MTTSAAVPVVSIQKFGWAKKVILLVDVNPQTRDSRSKMLRSLGVTVHAAANVRAALLRYQSGAYNLVLVDLGPDVAGAEQLAEAIKRAKPRQLVAFLIGQPLYLGASPRRANAAKASGTPMKRDDRVRTLQSQPATAVDFGQKVRDAETLQQKTA